MRTASNLLLKFWNFDQSFKRNILTPYAIAPTIKMEISTHVQIETTRYHILFPYFMTCIKPKRKSRELFDN